MRGSTHLHCSLNWWGFSRTHPTCLIPQPHSHFSSSSSLSFHFCSLGFNFSRSTEWESCQVEASFSPQLASIQLTFDLHLRSSVFASFPIQNQTLITKSTFFRDFICFSCFSSVFFRSCPSWSNFIQVQRHVSVIISVFLALGEKFNIRVWSGIFEPNKHRCCEQVLYPLSALFQRLVTFCRCLFL